MRLLVVNADDFGLTEGVNRGILEAHCQGILTSATLLANAPAFDAAVELAQSTPRLGLGVHLNLTEGHAISEPSEIPNLTDPTGGFYRSAARLAQAVLIGRVPPREIEFEWTAQIEKVFRAGILATHLDGHKHVHMLPGVAPIAARLARQFGIPAVRCAGEPSLGLVALLRRASQSSDGGRSGTGIGLLKQHVKARALSALAPSFRAHMREAGVFVPMHFYGITETGYLDWRRLEEILWNLPEGSSELMCHPGYPDALLRQTGTRLLGQRQTELEALTCPEVRKPIQALGIQLVTYRELARA